jgi:uncharacterized protein
MCTKAILVLTLSCIATAFPAAAQEMTKQAKIERMLTLSHVDRMMDQMMEQIKTITSSQLPANVTPEQRAKVEETTTKIMDLVKQRLSWDKMRPEYVKLYSDTYSDEEVNGILAFYESSAGQAMLEKMPELMAKSMALAQAQMSDILPEIQRISKEAAAQK